MMGTGTRGMFSAVEVGDKIRFRPQSSNRWWTVTARDERYVIAVQQAPFQPKGDFYYTVVDLDSTRTHNGVTPGVVRSSLNTIGGGWDIGPNGERSHEVLAALSDGWELSLRRIMQVHSIEAQP